VRQVVGFLRVLPFSSTNKSDSYDINEILLKVALNTTTLTLNITTQTNSTIMFLIYVEKVGYVAWNI